MTDYSGSVGKIDMSSYQMSPSIPEYSFNPDELSLTLKYHLAIQVNLSILILAHPKWSVLLKAIFTTDATSILLLSTHSLSVSPLACSLGPFFPFYINMTTVYVFDY